MPLDPPPDGTTTTSSTTSSTEDPNAGSQPQYAVTSVLDPKAQAKQALLRSMEHDPVHVQWFYGAFVLQPEGGRKKPNQLISVDDQNESNNPNVLHISNFTNPGSFYQPSRQWYFAAAVTFKSRINEEAGFALVDFEVSLSVFLSVWTGLNV